MNDENLETTLKTMRWRGASPEFMKRSLAAALRERESSPVAVQLVRSQRSTPDAHREDSERPVAAQLGYFPRALRIPLVACWLLSLFFHFTTPDPVSPQTREAIAHMPPVDPALLLAKLEEQEQLIAELLKLLEMQHQGGLSSKPPLFP